VPLTCGQGAPPGHTRAVWLSQARLPRATPTGSSAVILNPQQDVHHAAPPVAGDRVYLVSPEVISDIASRLTSA
jgi:hypothetical protein